MIRRFASISTGAVVYLIVVGRIDGWSVLQGVLIAAAALLVARRSTAEDGTPLGGWRIVRELGVLGWQVVTGTWKVASVALGLRPLPRSRTLEVTVGTDPAVHPGVLAVLETLSPGSYLLDVDEERGSMLFHMFDEEEAEELAQRHAELLGRDRDDDRRTEPQEERSR